MTPMECAKGIASGGYDQALGVLCTREQIPRQKDRMAEALQAFSDLFGENRQVRLFSAPGRTEIGGNHTDHQRGRVLAASVNMDVICVASPNDNGVIRIQSEGFPRDEVEITSLAIRDDEKNRAVSLIRGIAARCEQLGYKIGGFDAYTVSNVLKGSGLSSSAAFEVAVGVMISGLFNDGAISAVEIAQMSQYAENVYFGKPSGLMDQMASSVGGLISIDFADPENPVIEPVDFDFTDCGYTLCIVDTRGDHADLTPEYAAIPLEMGRVSAMFGKQYLREVDPDAFYSRLAEVRERCGDRAALRAIHFFGDNHRVVEQVAALEKKDFPGFLRLLIESGRSSLGCLQNVFACSDPQHQGVSLALAVSERLLADSGAWRVHGGGFAGTIQAFVPDKMVDSYANQMDQLFGPGACHCLAIRPVGGTEIHCR